jgi:type I restriction enzyme S subunit
MHEISEHQELEKCLSLMRNGTTAEQIPGPTAYLVTRIETIANGTVNYEKTGYLASPAQGYETEAGDILYSHINSVKHVGKVATVAGDQTLFHGMNLLLLRTATSTDSKYLYHFLSSTEAKAYAERECQKAINQVSLNTGQLKRLRIFHPSLPEQKKIAQILDTLGTQIQKTEALITKLEKIKEGLLHDLLTRGIDQNGQLRPTPEQAPELYKESALGLIPKEWEIRSIAESGVKLIDGDRGANYPSDQDFTTGSGHCVFLSAKNVTRSGFRFDTRQFVSKDKDRVLGTGKLVRDDVIVTTRGTVGNFAHYSHSIPFDHIRINSGMLILRSAQSNLLPEFLYLSLKEHLFDRENSRKGSGSAQPQLPARDFQSFLLVIPDQEEQQKIMALSSMKDQTIKAETQKHQKLLSLKSALMDDLLTGHVRVTPLIKDAV